VSGPAEPVGVGSAQVMVRLSASTTLGSVRLLLEPAGGDAVYGQDYRLPGEATPVVVSFAPGETSKEVRVSALPNIARTTVRVVKLRLLDSLSADLGSPDTVELALAPSQPGPPPPTGEAGVQVYLPLVRR
jgi:hypothetical protein